MYINLKYLAEKGLFFTDIYLLQLAKQQRTEDCHAYLFGFEDNLALLQRLGFIESIKGKRKDSAISRLRISKAGEEVLCNVEIPEILSEDIVLFEWVKSIYLTKDKKLGNQKKTKLYIALFRAHSGIDRNKLALLLSTFLNDENNMKYNNILERVFHHPENVYATRFDLSSSRLYNYYLTHQEHFDEQFKTL